MTSSRSVENDLYKKISITLFLLLIYRVGSYIPVFGISAISNNFSDNVILNLLNSLSGGSFGRMSIFTLAIMPYITASIIFQLLQMSYKPLENLKKEGQAGRLKINQWTKYLALVIAFFQSYGVISYILYGVSGTNSLVVNAAFFKILGVITITTGTFVVIWLADNISKYGFGNGSSLIIFIGIISSIPSGVVFFFELLRTGGMSISSFFVVLFSLLFLIVTILFFEQAQRKILVYYPRRQMGNKIFAADSNYIPLKFNTSGVIPPIFATTLLTFGASLGGFFFRGDFYPTFLLDFFAYIQNSQIFYNIFFVILIIFFSFFYTSTVFNSEEVADGLRKYGAYLPGKKPGGQTARFFDYVLIRLTTVGSIYLSFVCIVPESIINKYAVSLSLGGTSLLIVVNVILDTLAQLQSYLFSDKYEALAKKNRIKK